PVTERIMKYEHAFPIVSGVCLVIILVGTAAATKPDPKTATVTIKSLSFDPKRLEIHVGDSVVWANESKTVHTATSDNDGKTFDTGDVEPGKSSKPVKFEKDGEFKYHCKVHGKSMSGTIVVKPVEKK